MTIRGSARTLITMRNNGGIEGTEINAHAHATNCIPDGVTPPPKPRESLRDGSTFWRRKSSAGHVWSKTGTTYWGEDRPLLPQSVTPACAKAVRLGWNGLKYSNRTIRLSDISGVASNDLAVFDVLAAFPRTLDLHKTFSIPTTCFLCPLGALATMMNVDLHRLECMTRR
jgi:hypothetical protein